MSEPQRGHRHYGKAAVSYQERIFIRAVDGAPVFDDAQTAGCKLVIHPVIQQDHAVGDVFFNAVPRQRSVAAFRCDDRGDAFRLQPAKKPAQFGSEDRGVRQPRKKRFQRIEYHPFRADRVDRVAQTDKQAFQVELTCFSDFIVFDLYIVDEKQVPGDQVRQIESKRTHILDEFLPGLLEGHENARLLELESPAGQEFDGQ